MFICFNIKIYEKLTSIPRKRKTPTPRPTMRHKTPTPKPHSNTRSSRRNSLLSTSNSLNVNLPNTMSGLSAFSLPNTHDIPPARTLYSDVTGNISPNRSSPHRRSSSKVTSPGLYRF